MNHDIDIEKLKNIAFVMGKAVTEVYENLVRIFSNVDQTFRDIYLGFLTEDERERFLKKERHRKKYYRMMERRKK